MIIELFIGSAVSYISYLGVSAYCNFLKEIIKMKQDLIDHYEYKIVDMIKNLEENGIELDEEWRRLTKDQLKEKWWDEEEEDE